jgi:hypothetical protein
MIEYLRWVKLADVGQFLAKGWTIRDDAATIHHGFYSVLMIWTGEGEP